MEFGGERDLHIDVIHREMMPWGIISPFCSLSKPNSAMESITTCKNHRSDPATSYYLMYRWQGRPFSEAGNWMYCTPKFQSLWASEPQGLITLSNMCLERDYPIDFSLWFCHAIRVLYYEACVYKH